VLSREEIVRSVYERWNSDDMALEAFDDDVEWLMPYPDAQGRGKDAMAAAVVEYIRAWSEFELTVDEVRELDDERVFVLFTERVRGRHSDIEHVNRPAALWTFRGDLVTRFQGWQRRGDAYADLGMEP
jgi:hypothetical protein